MSIKVVKFGGSSLADADKFRRVAEIIAADPDRRYVVPSAPGKRFSDDIKITDMLYQCYNLAREASTKEEFVSLHGAGERIYEIFGKEIVELIRDKYTLR
mgnify:CR=1 FL=1